MLNPQLAQKQLEDFQDRDYDKKQRNRTAELPEPLRTIGYALMGRDAAGKRFNNGLAFSQEKYEKQVAAQREAIERLDELTTEERLSVFAAFCPNLAPALEASWSSDGLSTFQVGAFRRAFRVTADRETTRQKRWARIEAFLTQFGIYSGQDAVWFATWAAYLGYASGNIGWLLADTINARLPESDEVFDILIASAKGDHEIGAMGRHVTRALLLTDRREGWEFVERLLLAAHRQEGLRQEIFEAVDESHPEAFRRMLRLVIEHDLLRFSAGPMPPTSGSALATMSRPRSKCRMPFRKP
ncbi:MAG: hypothetical protein OHK0029_23000 [Armatimonadaceae bacterium]